MNAAETLPNGFCDWLAQQANGPSSEQIELADGRLLTRVVGRDDPVGDLGAALRWQIDTEGDEPEDHVDLVQIALDERAAHGVWVLRSDIQRAVRDALHEFARHKRRRLK